MSPVVLGIDTSGSWCSAALVRGPHRHVRRAEVGNAHSTHLLAMIDDVLAEAGLPLSACDAIAFSAGPGSFTGLRVGCAVAQGLAFGAGLPVVAVGTLEAIARAGSHDDDEARTCLVAQDARMGEVYWMLLERTEGRLVPVHGPSLASPDGMRDALRSLGGDGGMADLGCGNAWRVHAAALEGLGRRVVTVAAADAVDVAALGVEAVREGRPLLAAEDAHPIYVRNEVALTTAQRAARKAARDGVATVAA